MAIFKNYYVNPNAAIKLRFFLFVQFLDTQNVDQFSSGNRNVKLIKNTTNFKHKNKLLLDNQYVPIVCLLKTKLE